ncbi:sperm motility kinase X-like [Mesocricetus auratus]|uniref:non-specific serine/threonine protein kinase n=1 Tax=Mesocricetus auratus TaxID=10036 RepID=A0ABM2WQK3_MESAU|nr:sperm motility kinase X-like [Mesocricetus auratus]
MEQGREACCSSEDSFLPDYKMLKTVGQGQFSKVKLAIHVPTVTHVAVKLIRNDKEYASVVASEINIMNSLKHPHIIELFHVFQSRDTTFLVMEHASGGDLYRYIMEQRCLRESEARRLFTQIVLAVQYCHNNQIAHRDIKAENILLDIMGNAKLCDFGLAAKVPPGDLLTDFCGTPIYCAPEIYFREAYDGFAADVWSLGVLLYLMVVGRFPFWARSPEGLRRQILDSKYSIPEHISTDIFTVIIRLLKIYPGSRPTIDQVMTCPMITDTLARLPPSTQRLPGTLTPGRIVSSMTVMGYKSEENIHSLREQKDKQVMATYLILKHESSVGDSCHQPVKPRQSGLVLNLGDRHTFPVPLRRATEPAPLAFTMSCSLQETEHENNARQGGTRHSMPATLCHLSERPQPPHLVVQNGHSSLDLTRSRVVMSQSSSESKIGSHVSPNDSVHSSLFLMFNDSCCPDPKETTCNTGSVSSWSYQEELCSSLDTAQSVTSRGPSSGDTRMGDSMIHEEVIYEDLNNTQEEAVTPEVTNTQDETITEERTRVDDVNMTHTEAVIEENIMEEEDMHREANISLEVRRTQAGHKTQDDSITEEEAITHGQPEVAVQASSPILRRHRWKGFKKTMVNCLRHLSCCLPPARRSHDACQNLAPKKRDHGVSHRAWWRPACCTGEEYLLPDYNMMKTLGQGNFSKVKLAIHIPTVTYVAVKLIRNDKEYASRCC